MIFVVYFIILFPTFSCLISSDTGELLFTFELFNGNMTLSKIDPNSATAVDLKTALTGKLTVSESVLGSQSFARLLLLRHGR